MKNILPLAFVATAMLFVSSVNAQETSKCEGCPVTQLSNSIAGDCEGKCESGGCCHGCPVTAAMAKLPKMTYRVGTENTCCAESAAKLAETNSAPIHYVVGENVFEDKTEAYTSLVEQTETMVSAFVTPTTCSESGCHTVAGKTCKCATQAGKNAELVKTAIKDIKMSYVVGEKTCNCPHEAGSLAKDSGEKMEYMVGEEKTCCNMTARLALAKAKYKAAVEALAAAEKQVVPATATTTAG